MLLEFGGTAINADCLYIVRLQLIPNIKNIQGTLIAVTSQKPYFQIRMLSCDLCSHLFKGIPGFTDYQFVDFIYIFFGKAMGQRMPL
jgi:hypothetical protein